MKYSKMATEFFIERCIWLIKQMYHPAIGINIAENLSMEALANRAYPKEVEKSLSATLICLSTMNTNLFADSYRYLVRSYNFYVSHSEIGVDLMYKLRLI